MALFLLESGMEPLGQFDCLDTDVASVLGGEVFVLDEASRSLTSTEVAAFDVFDGYIADQVDIGTPTATRPVARLADGYSTTFLDATKSNSRVEPRRLFYLGDDGGANYGTMLGGLLGDPVGLNSVAVAQGPTSLQASGKITLWDKPGTYGVSADAVADALSPIAGNLNDTPLPGALLYREHNTGKLTSASLSEDKIALFIEIYADDRSLVTTPNRLIGIATTYNRIAVQYLGPYANV